MTFDPTKHHRRSIRLKGYDYTSPGWYYVTVCTHDRKFFFGDVADGQMRLNDAGRMVDFVWTQLPHQFQHITLDARVVMPNHMHGILVVVGAPLVGALGGAGTRRPAPALSLEGAGTRPAPTMGDVVGAFKSITTYEYTLGVRQRNWPSFNGRLWQRNFYEHVIRNEHELNTIREYVCLNPSGWAYDPENPARCGDAGDDIEAIWGL